MSQERRQFEWLRREMRARELRGPEDLYEAMRALLLSVGIPARRVHEALRRMGLKPRKPVAITKPRSFWLPPEA